MVCLYGFGYDRSRDDYLLVLLSSSSLKLFSLRDNTWTEIEGPDSRCRSPDVNPKQGTLFNGNIHWLVDRHDLISMEVIVVFDLMGRKLLDMHLPHDLLFHAAGNYALLVSQEFLSICAMNYNHGYYNNSKFEMWVMKDYKLHSSWIKILDLFIDYPTPSFYPICFTKRGDIIGTDGGVGLIKYNDKGQPLEYRNYANNPVGFEVAMYTESLLSLPGNFEQV
jgi:F-box interacting protein